VELAGSFLALVDPTEYWRAALSPLKPARTTSLKPKRRIILSADAGRALRSDL